MLHQASEQANLDLDFKPSIWFIQHEGNPAPCPYLLGSGTGSGLGFHRPKLGINNKAPYAQDKSVSSEPAEDAIGGDPVHG
jgi:hypothetical protein